MADVSYFGPGIHSVDARHLGRVRIERHGADGAGSDGSQGFQPDV